MDPAVIEEFNLLCRRHGLDPRTAADELAAHHACSAAGSSAWLLLPSGRRLDLLNPSPLDMEVEDIAAGQAETIRWGGATNGSEPIRDAQHALLTLEIARNDSSRGLDPLLELAIAVHDASEGPLRFDPVGPLKPFLGAGYRQLDTRLQEAIHRRVGLPARLPAAWKPIIKSADRKAASCEAHHMTGWPASTIRNGLGITLAPLKDDPLARRYGVSGWMAWTRAQAFELYLAELKRLMARAGG